MIFSELVQKLEQVEHDFAWVVDFLANQVTTASEEDRQVLKEIRDDHIEAIGSPPAERSPRRPA